MENMEQIRKKLRSGVGKIISQYSPVSAPEECALFLSSRHQTRELCFVLEGHSRYMLNGSVYDAVPGTVFMIDRWIPHASGYREEDGGLVHLWIHLYGAGMHAGLMRVQHHGEYKLLSAHFILPEEFQTLLTRRWNQINSMKTVLPETVTEYMTLPVNAILDEVALQLVREKNVSENDMGSVIETLTKYIRMMNARDCSYRKLEKISGYNRFYLAHRFRQSTGFAIGDYVEKVRIEYTAAALKRGLKQKEIAFELGFSSPSNFWNWLRKHRKAVQREEQKHQD